MDHVMWLARIFGPLFFIAGLWMVLRTEEARKMWSSVKSNPGLFYLSGILNLFFGFFILSTYHAWTFGLALLLTLFGWIYVIRGIMVLFMPEKVMEFADKIEDKHKTLALIPLVVGFLLSWLAFA